MKGIVFTGFLEMVEIKFGLETVDKIIKNSELDSNGVYTSIGTYKFSEMVNLITNLSSETNVDVPTLIHVYGLYFFDTLVKGHPNIFKYYSTAFDLLAGIEKHIHVHVRKIYPEAELPYFIVHEESSNKLILEYQSERAMYQFALGLMERTFEFYEETAIIKKELINNDGTKVLFTLTR
jgi:hypothetical protein